MGRVLRRVPEDWEHPKDEQGQYIPLLDSFPYTEEEIQEGLEDGWLDASKPNYGVELMPQWSERERTHIQLYETTSEGTPISPVFPVSEIDALCVYAAEHCTVFADFTATAAEWKAMLWEGFVHHREGDIIFS
jgi:hypothetical protein